MARTASEHFEIPPELRAVTEKSVEQARQAFEGFISAAHRTVSAFEGQAETARNDAKTLSEKAVSFAEQNIASSFDFAQKLVRAKDVEELFNVQANYINTQMQRLTEQAKQLGEQSSRMAADFAKAKH